MAGQSEFYLSRHAGLCLFRRSEAGHPEACQKRWSGHIERSGGAGIAPGPGTGDDDAGNSRILHDAGTADHHQGQRQVTGTPPGLYGLCRRQDI